LTRQARAAWLAVAGLLLMPGASWADEPLLSFQTDVMGMNVTAAGIAAVDRRAEPDGFDAVHILLHPEAAAAFATFTGDAAGQVMQVFVCGNLVLAPRVMDRIEGGRIAITGPGAVKAASFLAALEGRAACP
jgi:preprotein translocase subunit SecD